MRTLIICSLVTLSQAAFAAFYAEPYVSYESGALDVDATITFMGNPVALTAEEDLTGAIYGVKLAYSEKGFGVGADIMMGGLEGEVDGSTTKYTSQDLGALVQLRFANRFKVSGTYFISSELEDDDDGSQEGSGFKIGFGYVILNHLSLNVDYLSITYDEGNSPGLTVTEFESKRNSVALGISFPIEF